jgi:biopolymer transport protein ExbB/TolQ
MCGIAYGSLFGQIAAVNQPDPSGVAVGLVLAFKALGLALGIVGLVGSLRGRTIEVE